MCNGLRSIGMENLFYVCRLQRLHLKLIQKEHYFIDLTVFSRSLIQNVLNALLIPDLTFFYCGHWSKYCNYYICNYYILTKHLFISRPNVKVF